MEGAVMVHRVNIRFVKKKEKERRVPTPGRVGAT